MMATSESFVGLSSLLIAIQALQLPKNNIRNIIYISKIERPTERWAFFLFERNLSMVKIYEDGTKRHYNTKGQLHCLDGPAAEYSYGEVNYWIEGVQLTEKEFNERK